MSNGRVVIDVAPQNHEIMLYRDLAGISLVNELGKVYRENGYDVEYWIVLDRMTREQFERCKIEARNYINELNEKYKFNIDPIRFVDETRIKDIPEKYEEYLRPFIGLLEKVEPLLEGGRLSCTAAETVIYRSKVEDRQGTICVTGYPEFYAKLYKRGYRDVEKLLSEILGASIFSFIYPEKKFDHLYLDTLYSLFYVLHNEKYELNKEAKRDILSTVEIIGKNFDSILFAKNIPQNREEFLKWIKRSTRRMGEEFLKERPKELLAISILLGIEWDVNPNVAVPDTYRKIVKELY